MRKRVEIVALGATLVLLSTLLLLRSASSSSVSRTSEITTTTTTTSSPSFTSSVVLKPSSFTTSSSSSSHEISRRSLSSSSSSKLQESKQSEENSDSSCEVLLECLECCGNGVVESGEDCDSGAQRSDLYPDLCRCNCTFASCGDGVIDKDEECEPPGTTFCSDSCINSWQVAPFPAVFLLSIVIASFSVFALFKVTSVIIQNPLPPKRKKKKKKDSGSNPTTNVTSGNTTTTTHGTPSKPPPIGLPGNRSQSMVQGRGGISSFAPPALHPKSMRASASHSRPFSTTTTTTTTGGATGSTGVVESNTTGGITSSSPSLAPSNTSNASPSLASGSFSDNYYHSRLQYNTPSPLPPGGRALGGGGGGRGITSVTDEQQGTTTLDAYGRRTSYASRKYHSTPHIRTPLSFSSSSSPSSGGGVGVHTNNYHHDNNTTANNSSSTASSVSPSATIGNSSLPHPTPSPSLPPRYRNSLPARRATSMASMSLDLPEHSSPSSPYSSTRHSNHHHHHHHHHHHNNNNTTTTTTTTSQQQSHVTPSPSFGPIGSLSKAIKSLFAIPPSPTFDTSPTAVGASSPVINSSSPPQHPSPSPVLSTQQPSSSSATRHSRAPQVVYLPEDEDEDTGAHNNNKSNGEQTGGSGAGLDVDVDADNDQSENRPPHRSTSNLPPKGDSSTLNYGRRPHLALSAAYGSGKAFYEGDDNTGSAATGTRDRSSDVSGVTWSAADGSLSMDQPVSASTPNTHKSNGNDFDVNRLSLAAPLPDHGGGGSSSGGALDSARSNDEPRTDTSALDPDLEAELALGATARHVLGHSFHSSPAVPNPAAPNVMSPVRSATVGRASGRRLRDHHSRLSGGDEQMLYSLGPRRSDRAPVNWTEAPHAHMESAYISATTHRRAATLPSRWNPGAVRRRSRSAESSVSASSTKAARPRRRSPGAPSPQPTIETDEGIDPDESVDTPAWAQHSMDPSYDHDGNDLPPPPVDMLSEDAEVSPLQGESPALGRDRSDWPAIVRERERREQEHRAQGGVGPVPGSNVNDDSLSVDTRYTASSIPSQPSIVATIPRPRVVGHGKDSVVEVDVRPRARARHSNHFSSSGKERARPRYHGDVNAV